jgi:glycosyltransferase involved in cell wall biosynthesis
MVLGIRGMPNVQGGVETHAEQLCTRLAGAGCDVEVIVRTPFVPIDQITVGPIKLRHIWSPRRSGLEALIHSFLGVLYAGVTRPDILHIHAIGPSLVTPLARLMRLKVVVTHHGPDYDRDKWGPLGRLVLRLGERFGMTFANECIAISAVIQGMIRKKYRRESRLIPNGVVAVPTSAGTEYIRQFGLERGRYFLEVARIVAEKRQDDLIEAFGQAAVPGWRLVIVGAGDQGDYGRAVRQAAARNGVVMTGYQTGEALRQLYSHAGAFVLPSSHEGLPIALLEALNFGLPVIASSIPANLEVELPASSYFPVGDVSALARRMAQIASAHDDESAREKRRVWVRETYDWDLIAQQTVAVYRDVLDGRSRTSSSHSCL